MRKNKIIPIILIILIVAILSILIIMLYSSLAGVNQVSSEDLENEQLNTQVTQNIEAIQPSINTEEDNDIFIIKPITEPEDSEKKNDNLYSSYYYSQLNEDAKKFYDGLKENKENLTSGNYTIDYGTEFNTILNSEGGKEKVSTDFQSAWNAFSYDNIDLFYIDVSKVTLTSEQSNLGGIITYSLSIGPGENDNYFLNSFKNEDEVKNAIEYLENIKEQMIEQTANDNIYTKIAKVHNWLIYFVNYEESTNSKDQYTIYGALKNGKAVCEGYARAFKYFMDGIGVPCVLASGTAQNSQGETESHAWNYVQIDNKWYATDVTWDDPVVMGGEEQTDEMKYQYFLKGSEEFFKDHKEDGKISELSMEFKFPTLATENYRD